MGIPQVFGSMRLAGNVIWARPLIEKRRKQSAGKGGGGQAVVSYEYFATFAVALARGPVDAIRRVWADGKLLVDLSENAQQGKTYRYGERIYRFHPGWLHTSEPDARGSHRFARLSPLPCLAPDIVEAILDRRQPEADEAG